MDILANTLKQLRTDAGYKQDEMGNMVGATRFMVSSYENGREPPLNVLVKYAQIFDVSVDYLLGLDKYRKKPQAATDKIYSALAAVSNGTEPPLSPAAVESLLIAFIHYYRAGSPAGSAPADALREHIAATTHMLDAAARHDTAEMLDAVNQATTAILRVNDAMQSYLKSPETR